MDTCTYVFKRGQNAGHCCGSKVYSHGLCRTHCKIRSSAAAGPADPRSTFDLLPYPIVSQILQHLIHPNNVKLLHVLEATNKTFKDIIRQDDIHAKCWAQLAKAQKVDVNLAQRRYYSTKKCLELFGRIGCQLCGKARIRKVYVEYGVRCCTDCLHANTISDYQLDDKYSISNFHFLRNVRQRTVSMYNPSARAWSRSYEATFYWKTDVEDAVRTEFDCTLEQYRGRWHEYNQQKNYAKLEDYCEDLQGALSPEDVINNSDFWMDSRFPISDIKKYYTQAAKRIRENEILEFLQRFDDYASFNKSEITRTSHVNALMRNKTPLKDDDWGTIKAQVREREYKRHYEQFLAKFHPRQQANLIPFVVEKRNAQIRFTDEDVTKVHTLKPIPQRSNSKHCRYCYNSHRTFTPQGMRDHCRDVHGVILP
jgi:hypothetical protein